MTENKSFNVGSLNNFHKDNIVIMMGMEVDRRNQIQVLSIFSELNFQVLMFGVRCLIPCMKDFMKVVETSHSCLIEIYHPKRVEGKSRVWNFLVMVFLEVDYTVAFP